MAGRQAFLKMCTAVLGISMVAVGAHARGTPADLSLKGSVVVGSAEGAVPWAIVKVVNLESGEVREAVCDPEGQFVVDRLQTGMYELSAASPGLFQVSVGRRVVTSTVLTLVDETPPDVVLRMEPGGSISGSIMNRFGKPTVGASVALARTRFRDGLLGVGDVREIDPVSTDSAGQYRFFGLPPGNYIVSVGALLKSDTTPLEIPALPGLIRSPATMSQTSNSTSELFDYPVTFYPGVNSLDDAGIVKVDLGQQVTAVDVSQKIEPVGMIKGRVLRGDGQEPRNCRSIATRISVLRDARVRPERFDSNDCQFSFARALSGRYDIRVLSGSLVGIAKLDVLPPIETAVELTLREGFVVRGRVEFEDSAFDQEAAGQVRIMLLEAGMTSGIQPLAGKVNADGSFSISGVPEGRYRVDVRTPSPWKLAWIGSQDIDVADTLLDVGGASPGDTVVSLTRTLGQIRGRVDGISAEQDQYVLVFPQPPAYWTAPSRRIRWIRPARNGDFVIDNLPAGEYRVGIVRDFSSEDVFDPSFLRRVAADFIRAIVTKGSTAVVNMVVNRSGNPGERVK